MANVFITIALENERVEIRMNFYDLKGVFLWILLKSLHQSPDPHSYFLLVLLT